MALRALFSGVFGFFLLALVLFIPAGTFDYWQAWVFIAVFVVATLVPTSYLARTNPEALRRRMRAGPRAESRIVQKFIIIAAFVVLFAMMVFSAVDYRLGWSSVPAPVCLLGDALVATGLGVAMLVVVQNPYAAATVTVEGGQPVVSSGLYRFVRHPMYTGNVLMMLGMPLALGSYWGLLFLIPGIGVLIYRIADEEKLLIQELAGYREYLERVRYRLIPYAW
ncbi:methyltransferase family protein [Mycobacterium basiliense]|uniref:methyltransferase family protein n=1 Tax=Mycobacterium basiliense TaxID=2094119 RepID=UPI0038CC1370